MKEVWIYKLVSSSGGQGYEMTEEIFGTMVGAGSPKVLADELKNMITRAMKIGKNRYPVAVHFEPPSAFIIDPTANLSPLNRESLQKKEIQEFLAAFK